MINFNTSRFIDVTTPRQSAQGTIVFHDTENPGVFYASYQSGYVRRIIKTTTQTTSPFGSTSFNNTVMYPLNSRKTATNLNDNTYVTINSVSNRLGRIAEMADKFNAQRGSIVTTNVDGNTVSVTVPRIVSSVQVVSTTSTESVSNTPTESSTPTKTRRRRNKKFSSHNRRRRSYSNRRRQNQNNSDS